MKKILFVLMMLVFVSCETSESLNKDIDGLKSRKTELSTEVSSLTDNLNAKRAELATLETKAKELGMLSEGKTPKYILKLHLKQSHFSLSIKKHISDAVNAIDFELPVDKDFYNSVEVGTKVVDEFRTGSFFLKGSFGDWEMTVKDKEIR